MADSYEPPFPSVITHRLPQLRELLSGETSHQTQGTNSSSASADGQQSQRTESTSVSGDPPELVWGQWANWASWTKIL